MIVIGGLKDEAEDKRDKLYSWDNKYGSEASLEPEIDLWLPGQKIRSQVGNSCGGFATQYSFRMSLFHETGNDPGELSGMFPYWLGRKIHDDEDNDDGSYLRNGVLKGVQLQGLCIEKVFSDDVPFNKQPTWRAIKNGMKHRGLRSFRRIYNPVEAMGALSMGQALVGGWHVGDDWSNWQSSDPFVVETNKRGGHAMSICGYDEDGNFISPGSWGTHNNKGEPQGDPTRPGFWKMSPEFLISAKSLFALDMTPNE